MKIKIKTTITCFLIPPKMEAIKRQENGEHVQKEKSHAVFFEM